MRLPVPSLAAALLLLPFLLVVPARAGGGTTYTWIGNSQTPMADNHSWTDQRNWDPQGVPGDGDSVVITQPGQAPCFAHVDNVPTVSLVNLTLAQDPTLCTVSVEDGAITVSGLFQWNGGQLKTPVTVTASGTASILGSNGKLSTLTTDLDVHGTVSLLGVTGDGALRIDGGETLHVEPGANFVSTGPNEIDGSECCVNPPVVRNEGTLAIHGSTLTIEAAKLAQQGDVTATLDGQLVTSDAPITTANNASYTGNGSWLIQTRAALNLKGTQTIGHGFRIDYGGLGSTFSSTLTGTATLQGHGTFAWTGGVIEADLTFAHTLAVEAIGAHTGGAARLLRGDGHGGIGLHNHAVLTVGGGAVISTALSARFVNASDGVLTLEPGTSISGTGCCVSPDRIVNAGTVTVLPAPNAGPVVFGFLAYRSTGVTGIAAGRTLQLTGGAPDVLTGGTVSGGGELLVNTPVALSGNVRVGTNTVITLSGHGSLNGTTSLVGAGRLSWIDGSMSGQLLSLDQTGGTTVSGPATKSVTNIGGGSQTSTVRFTTPLTTAAGTAQAHDLINIGASRVILAAPTDAGAFTEFAGQLLNRATLALHAGPVTTNAYDQSSSAALSLSYTGAKHGKLSLFGPAAIDGTVRVRNSAAPGLGDKIVVVDAGTLTGSPSCVTTSGTRATGSNAGHWAASTPGSRLVLEWRTGAHTHC